MEHAEFRATVAERAPELSVDVDDLVDATLVEVGRYVSPGEAVDLADRLPGHDAERLERSVPDGPSPPPVESFLDDVARESGVDREQVEEGVRAVFDTVAEAAGRSELADARAQFPAAYDDLLEPREVPGEHTFVERVAAETDLDGQEARDAAEAALETLGDRLSRGEAEDLAHPLADDGAAWLVQADPERATDLSREAFVGRIADREGVDPDSAREHARAVYGILADATGEEFDRALEQLPPEYAPVLPE
ncbi:MAG: DUF2267 domain-containing protein [Halobacteriaceae archaeon]